MIIELHIFSRWRRSNQLRRILQHDDALNPLFRTAVLKYVQTARLKTAADSYSALKVFPHVTALETLGSQKHQKQLQN
jgi:hypothetical protein